MRPYRRPTSSERDARTERRIERRLAEGSSPREPIPVRNDGVLVLSAGGQEHRLTLRPARHAWQWVALREDGTEFARGGLERIWRKIQAERALPLGARNLDDF
jgi:hypothetical protein